MHVSTRQLSSSSSRAKNTSSIFSQRSNHYKAHLRVGLIMDIRLSG
jgi:hypothetical protein